MLFKKKDENESVKAKTSLFASKAKKDDAHEKDEERAIASMKSKKAVVATDTEKTLKVTVAAGKVSADILVRPRITEKASNESSKNIYTFDVAPFANKTQIAAAIKDIYRVTPIAIRVVTIPARQVIRRGRAGVVSGGKKAYVHLKKGDKIELA
jgi:large subunit ribosomal protein L23